MDKVEEHKDGKLISKYNKLFLRGNNVLYILPKAARQKKVEKQNERGAAESNPTTSSVQKKES